MLNESRALMRRRALMRWPLWIIISYQNDRMEVLTIDPDGDGGSLPVFSFEEEAEVFLRLSVDDEKKMGWRSRQTTAGELISVLLAPCPAVRRAVLDPLPLPLGGTMLPFVGVTRERLLEELQMGQG